MIMGRCPTSHERIAIALYGDMDFLDRNLRSLSSKWQSFSIRLKLVWTCFGLFLFLQLVTTIVGFLWPEGTIGGLALTFIACVIMGLLVGLLLCDRGDTSIVRGDQMFSWTEPLTAGIQDIYLQPPFNEHVKEEHHIHVPEELFQVGNELDYFVQFIMRDFIHIWYDEYIDGDDNFPFDISNILTYTFSEVLSRLRSVDLELLLDRSLKEVHRHLMIMEKSKNNLRRLCRPIIDQNNHNLVACYETFSVMHPAASMSEDLELDYLRSALGMVFDCVLPQNIKVCQPGVCLVREVISQIILLKAINLISDPDFLNDTIILLASFIKSEVNEPELPSKKSEKIKADQKSSRVTNSEKSHNGQPLSNGTILTNMGEVPHRLDSYYHKLSSHEEPQSYHQERPVDLQYLSVDAQPSLPEFRETRNNLCAQNIKTFLCNEKHDELTIGKADPSVDGDILKLRQSSAVAHLEDNTTNHQRPRSENCLDIENPTKEPKTFSPSEILEPNFNQTATFSSLSNMIPVLLPKRNKSPAFSTLSKSVDSIIDLEAVSDELVPERKERKGHSRRSSFPSFTPEYDREDDQVESDQDEMLEDVEGRNRTDKDEEQFISNLVISSTEKMKEQHSKKMFVLYIVKFNILASRGDEETHPAVISRQTKRRYSEFVTLHWKLEQQADLKKFLKGVKDAPKRFALPIMRKDIAGIEHRRVTLERYLKQLIDIPKIETSQEMAEFLALHGDADIAFVRNSTLYVPKFDKILRNSFSGMKQGLKSLAPFPSSKSDQKIDRTKTAAVQPNSAGIEEDEDAISSYVYRICSVAPKETAESSLMDLMPYLIQDALTGLELAVEAMQDTSDLLQSDVIGRMLKDGSSINNNNTKEKTGQHRLVTNSSDFVLYSSIMDIVGLLQKDQSHWIFEENVQQLLRNVTGDFIERFMKREVKTFLSPQSWAVYLALIREAVWPDGTLFRSSGEVLSSEEKHELYKKAEDILLNSYPGILNIIIGKDNITGAISQLHESVQNQQLNKHLIYTFIDLVLAQALPEVQENQTKETSNKV